MILYQHLAYQIHNIVKHCKGTLFFAIILHHNKSFYDLCNH